MKWEWKKHEKSLYGAKQTPALIEAPRQHFIRLCGSGNPNGADFSARVSALFSLAYAMKMGYRAAAKGLPPDAVQDYAVYPLEGVWGMRGAGAAPGGGLDKEQLAYTLMIRQPDFITPEDFAAALERLRRKKPGPLIDEIRFEAIEDGLCVEILHPGPYDDEPRSFARMDRFAAQNGLVRCGAAHREVYLTGRAAAQQKTILRYPVRPADEPGGVDVRPAQVE